MKLKLESAEVYVTDTGLQIGDLNVPLEKAQRARFLSEVLGVSEGLQIVRAPVVKVENIKRPKRLCCFANCVDPHVHGKKMCRMHLKQFQKQAELARQYRFPTPEPKRKEKRQEVAQA